MAPPQNPSQQQLPVADNQEAQEWPDFAQQRPFASSHVRTVYTLGCFLLILFTITYLVLFTKLLFIYKSCKNTIVMEKEIPRPRIAQHLVSTHVYIQSCA